MLEIIIALVVEFASNDLRAFLPPKKPTLGLDIGYVREGKIYSVCLAAEKTLIRFEDGRALDSEGYIPGLLAMPIRFAEAVPPERKPAILNRWHYSRRFDLSLLTWRLAHDALWAHNPEILLGDKSELTYVRWEDLPLFDINNERGPQQLKKKYPDKKGFSPYNVFRTMRARGFEPREDGDDDEIIQFDFWPYSDRGCLEFRLYKGKQPVIRCENHELDLYEFKGRGGLGVPIKEVPKKFDEREFRVEFREAFIVYGTRTHFYFITELGELHYWERPQLGEPISEVGKAAWKDPERRISTIVNDVKSNRTFVAGEDRREGKKGRYFYFELDPKPAARPYEPGRALKVHEAIRAPLQLARFLDEQKIIAVEPKAEPKP